MSDWIKATERKPKSDVIVLVITFDENGDGWISLDNYDRKTDKWVLHPTRTVVYWAKTPKPPEGLKFTPLHG